MHYQYLHMYMRQCLKLEHYNVLLYCIKFSLLGKESSCKLLETRSLFFKICWPCHDICSYNIFGDWVVVKFDLLCYCINDNCQLSIVIWFGWQLDDYLYLYLYIPAQLTWNIMNINITQNSRSMDLGHCSKKSWVWAWRHPSWFDTVLILLLKLCILPDWSNTNWCWASQIS